MQGPVRIDQDGTDEWEIETIVKEQLYGKEGKSYLVRWEGYGNREMRWLPKTEVAKCARDLLEWWDRMKREGFIQI